MAEGEAKPIDRKLVALMTGDMGDGPRVAKISADIGQAIAIALPDMMTNETGLRMAFSYAGCQSGMIEDLVANLPDFMILSDASWRGWCPKFIMACPSPLIIAMVESLLGGSQDDITDPVARAASKIELQMCPIMFEKIGWALKGCIETTIKEEVSNGTPYNAEDRPAPEEDIPDVFGTEIRIALSYGPVTSQLSVIVPQRHLLKTKVRPTKARSASKATAEWTEQLAEQVRRSDVRLEARIKLTALTLGTISRLQAGDVIPFLEKGDVRVDVNANGRDLYVAEFGRAGEQYMVRIKDTHGSEDELIKHLMG